MKISDIKTETEFYALADMWYQRTLRLRDIWQNDKESDRRRIKSFALFLIMQHRVMKLTQIAINQTKKIPNF